MQKPFQYYKVIYSLLCNVSNKFVSKTRSLTCNGSMSRRLASSGSNNWGRITIRTITCRATNLRDQGPDPSRFLRNWQFNDYAEHLHLVAGERLPGNTTWQSFEAFLLFVLDFVVSEDGEEVPFESLYSGCKLQDDEGTMVVNKHLIEAVYRTDLRAGKTQKGTLNTCDQLFHVILNSASAALAISFSVSRYLHSGLRIRGAKLSVKKLSVKSGSVKLMRKKLTQATSPDDIFILYTSCSLMRLAGIPISVPFPVVHTWRCTAAPEIKNKLSNLKCHIRYKQGICELPCIIIIYLLPAFLVFVNCDLVAFGEQPYCVPSPSFDM